jgi:hypothetical protein
MKAVIHLEAAIREWLASVGAELVTFYHYGRAAEILYKLDNRYEHERVTTKADGKPLAADVDHEILERFKQAAQATLGVRHAVTRHDTANSCVWCEKAGEPLHQGCGWCATHRCPSWQCIGTDREHPPNWGLAMAASTERLWEELQLCYDHCVPRFGPVKSVRQAGMALAAETVHLAMDRFDELAERCAHAEVVAHKSFADAERSAATEAWLGVGVVGACIAAGHPTATGMNGLAASECYCAMVDTVTPAPAPDDSSAKALLAIRETARILETTATDRLGVAIHELALAVAMGSEKNTLNAALALRAGVAEAKL